MVRNLKMDEHSRAVMVQPESSHLYLEKSQQISTLSMQQMGRIGT